ncbi:MAG TPA: DNA alkylation repair protein [Clostridia bacterium]|nr:DNA alkylation repair protein [Clostridia bacterium]
MNSHNLKQELKRLANPKRADNSLRFFKTAKGEYGEGDIFLGITTPVLKKIVRKYQTLSLSELPELLESPIHEHRSAALGILVLQFGKADERQKEKLVAFYLKNTVYINNWDLVDISAAKILGEFLLDKDKKVLFKLAGSDNLWERRIAIIATYAFIKRDRFKETLEIAKVLLHDKHDLVHKAVGWMLREVGKKDQAQEEEFLKKHYRRMPRTMLRYAIEKFAEEKRKLYLRRE